MKQEYNRAMDRVRLSREGETRILEALERGGEERRRRPAGRAPCRTAEKKTGKMIANEGQSLWMVRYPIVPGPQWLEMVAPARSTRTSSK